VEVLPEVTSDIQNVCKELEKDRRWKTLKVNWETGDVEADKDVEDPGYARLRLTDPAHRLPAAVFPVKGYKTCQALLDSVNRPYLVPSSYGFHHGVDINLPRGTAIVAARGGTITRLNNTCEPDEQVTANCPGCGNWVEIDDGKTIYQYCHLKQVAEGLAVGHKVRTGQDLGVSGNTGLSGNVPHLHFTVVDLTGVAPVSQKFWSNAYPYLDAWCSNKTCPE
jgi:murein DD-endopeptidase MepM/ murein hydrolase activator NlpD